MLLFDEIQNVEGWERFIARLLPSHKIIITGSNARLMSKELATFLTGRHIGHELFPFSFREYLRYKKMDVSQEDTLITAKKAKLYNLLNEYIRVGGFPLSARLGKEFLLELYSDIIERDILARYSIKYKAKIKEVSKYLISNLSSEISFNKLSGIFGVKGTHTIQNWIGYLQNSYLIFTLERFSYKLKERSLAPKKVYSIDTGLSDAVAFSTSPNRGKTAENVVAIELLRRRSYWRKGMGVYYWKDHAQNEVDFVVKEGNKAVQLLQVTYSHNLADIEGRELSSIIKASEELRCRDLLVINWDYDDEIRHKGKTVRIKSILNWLLEPLAYQKSQPA